MQLLLFLELPSWRQWLIIFFIPFSHLTVNLSLLIYESWHFVYYVFGFIFPSADCSKSKCPTLSTSSVVTSTMHLEEPGGKCKKHCSRSTFPQQKLFSFFFFFAFLQKNIMVMNKNLACMVLLPLFFVRRRKRGSELFTGNPLKLELVHNLLLTTLDWSTDYFQFAHAQAWWSDVEIMYLTQ